MSEHGLIAYDLAGNWCEECGRAKSLRLMDVLTGCKTCDEVITRHRCTGRPDIEVLAGGQTWECPECGSRWTPYSVQEDCPDCCGDCGHQITVRRWDSVAGDRMDTAPRHDPQPWMPFRRAMYDTMRAMTAPIPSPGLPGSCYRTGGGLMVHVKPGCRCRD